MTELWLNFTDEEGYPKRVSVNRDVFIIGRHPDNDLSIADTRLSRQHLQIERFNETFTASDCGSSNGTKLNFDELFESATLHNGDVLNLGGGVEIKIEIVFANRENETSPLPETPAAEIPKNQSSANMSGDAASFGGVPSNFFYIAPALGLLLLLFIGGLLWIFSDNSEDNGNREIAEKNEREEKNEERENRRTPRETKTPSFPPSPTNSGENQTVNQTPNNNGTPTQTPVISSETEKIKQTATEFMRRIALNDANPFLKNEQVDKVNQKIRNFRNSSGLAENLRAVGRDKSQYETLASSQNLKPQFLAAAALNEIGNRSGNPLETAKTMLPVLGKLKIRLGNDFADDNFLIIAAYNQGKKGDFNLLQGKIEGLSKTLSKKGESVTPRELRTIWFLRNKDRLTEAEFEYAVNFLALGIIMQNPKEFGVNAEAVVF